MQILLALIFGAAVGLAAEMLVPGRDTRGNVLGPILGAVAAALVWTALTWAGLGIADPAIWIAAVVAPALIAPITLLLLARVRSRHDDRERQRLRIG
ncbi:MAG: hypothetical protein PGN24_12910 [Microbacterium arborescens]